MQINSPKLFIEINNAEYIFAVGDENDKENFKLIYKSIVPIQGIKSSKIIDFNLVFNTIKKNIYIIEQKLNYTFKETILIINNVNYTFINLTGFKKLNGSQILKENITYILNSLKSCIDRYEDKKTILHIFNSQYLLDKKSIENLPIGLFGDFYSHELSFCLISKNDYKNLISIFNNCNLKIKKILLRNFVEGSLTSNHHSEINTFFQIKINENSSQLFYFENDSLKFEQNFEFGSDLIAKDISKITSLKIDIVKKILSNNKLHREISDDLLLEKEFFGDENFRKIKKKLFYQIAEARIQELSEIMISKNVNLLNFNKTNKIIFLRIEDKLHHSCFCDVYSFFFSHNNNFKVIPMGLDNRFYEMSFKKKIKTGRIKFLYIGRLIDYKGVDILLNSLALYKDTNNNFQLDILGTGTYLNELKNLSGNLGLDEHVNFAGFKSFNQKTKYIEECDLIIIPSKVKKGQIEGGPLTLVEGMSMGKVCIVSNSIGFIEHCNNGNSIIFESGNSESLLKAILKFESLTDLERNKLSSSAKKMSNKFSFEEIGRKHNEFFFGNE